MSLWKRNAVIVAIVVFVGAAVYLNWSYNQQSAEGEPEAGAVESAKLLGQAALVNGEGEGTASDEGGTGGEVGSGATGYFATARLNRQQARDSALELLRQAAADEGAAQSVIDEANASIQAMAANTLSEAQVENLVTAKGYAQCVCFIGEDSISVVVSALEEGLSQADIARIMEIAMEETGLRADQITIIETEP